MSIQIRTAALAAALVALTVMAGATASAQITEVDIARAESRLLQQKNLTPQYVRAQAAVLGMWGFVIDKDGTKLHVPAALRGYPPGTEFASVASPAVVDRVRENLQAASEFWAGYGIHTMAVEPALTRILHTQMRAIYALDGLSILSLAAGDMESQMAVASEMERKGLKNCPSHAPSGGPLTADCGGAYCTYLDGLESRTEAEALILAACCAYCPPPLNVAACAEPAKLLVELEELWTQYCNLSCQCCYA